MVPGSIKGTCPYDFPIKGNADSVIYHTSDSPYYFKTRAEICFDVEAAGVYLKDFVFFVVHTPPFTLLTKFSISLKRFGSE